MFPHSFSIKIGISVFNHIFCMIKQLYSNWSIHFPSSKLQMCTIDVYFSTHQLHQHLPSMLMVGGSKEKRLCGGFRLVLFWESTQLLIEPRSINSRNCIFLTHLNFVEWINIKVHDLMLVSNNYSTYGSLFVNL